MSVIIGPFRTRAQLHNSALPTANTNLITDITGSALFPNADQGPYKLKVWFSVSIATGTLNLRRTRTATTVTETLISGNTVANLVYVIDVYVDQGETINLQYTTTTGTINKLLVIETGIV